MKKHYYEFEDKQYNPKQNILTRTFKLLQKDIFNSIYWTLMNREKSNILNYILITLEWSQIILFFFQSYFIDLWDENAITNALRILSDFILIAPITKNLNYVVATISLMIIFVFNMAGFLLFYLVSNYSDRIQQNRIPLIIKINYYYMKFQSTILPFPFMMLMLQNTICQKDMQDNYTLKHYDQNCFGTMHIINLLFQTITLFLYLPYLFIIAQFFCETSYKLNRFTSRHPSYIFCFTNFYKVVLVGLYSIYSQQQNRYLVLLIAFLQMILLCKYFVYENDILNQKLQQTYRFFSLTSLWTISILLSVRIFGLDFFGQVFSLYIIGVTFIFLIISKQQKNIKNLQYRHIDYQSLKQTIDKLKYLVYLLHNNINLFCARQIDGLILDHVHQCEIKDCKIIRKYQKKRFQNYQNQKILLFKEFILQNFEIAINKYKNNTQLRFMYVLFLFDEMNMKQKVMQQLQIIKQIKPGLQIQFQVYKYSKYITENNEQQDDSKVNSEDEKDCLVYQNLRSNFINSLKKLTNLYVNFWSHLLEDNPKSYKLKKIGGLIYFNQIQLTQDWQKLAHSFQDKIVQEMFLYSQFQKKILKNKQEAKQLAKKARQIAQLKLQYQNNIKQITEKSILDLNSGNVIIISGQKENIGEILSVNNQLSKFFGYLKEELIGQNVTLLMPNILWLSHNQYLEESVNNKELNAFKRERKLFAVNSKGYLISIYININQILEPNPIFVADIRPEKHLQTEVYFLVDFKGFIHNVSQSVFTLFQIKKQTLKQFKYVTDLFPGLFKDKENYLDKQRLLRKEHMIDGPLAYMQNQNIQLQITEQKYRKLTTPFYILKFTQQKQVYQSSQQNICMSVKEKQNQLQFQFRINIKQNIIIGEKNKYRIFKQDHAIMQESNNKVSKQKDFFDYGESIETLRLKEGKIIKYEQNITEENLESLENKIFEKFQNLKSKLDIVQQDFRKKIVESFIKEGSLQNFVTKKKKPFFFILYKWIVNSFLLVFFTLQFFLFFYNYFQIQKLKNINHFYNDFSLLDQEIYNILDACKDLLTLNTSTQVYFTNKKLLQQQIEHNTQFIHYLEVHLFEQSGMVKEDVVTQKYISDTVSLNFNNEKKDLIFTEAINYIATFALQISNLRQQEITPQNQKIKALYQNINMNLVETFEDIKSTLIQIYKNYSNRFYVQIIVILIQWFLLIMLILVVLIFLKRFQQYEFINMKIFAEIDNKIIQAQILKCQTFLNNIQGKNEINLTQKIQSNQTQEEEDNEIRLLKKKRMIQSNIFKNHKSFLFQIIVLCISFVLASTIQSLRFESQQKNMLILNKELQIINSIPFELQRLKTTIFFEFNTDLKGYQDKSDEVIIKNKIQNIFTLAEELQISYNQSKSLHTKEYLEFSEKFMFKNLCDLANEMNNGKYDYENFNFYQPDINQCNDLLNSIYQNYVSSGYFMLLTQQIEKLKNFYNELLQARSTNNYQNLKNEFCKNQDDPSFDNCIFFSEEQIILDDIQKKFVNFFTQSWRRIHLYDIIIFYKNQMSNEHLLFITVILSLCFLFYLIYFLSFVNRKNKSIDITQNILLMIPKQFFKDQNRIKLESIRNSVRVQKVEQFTQISTILIFNLNIYYIFSNFYNNNIFGFCNFLEIIYYILKQKKSKSEGVF